MSETDHSAVPPAFPQLKLRDFISTGFGLLLRAPRRWQDQSDEALFRVLDPDTGTQFTASAYRNPGLDLAGWAEARLAVVDKEMPWLRRVRDPAPVQGNSWQGIAAEYRGVFPEEAHESHCLVLCIADSDSLISFTVVAETEVFAENETLYRWLTERQLDRVEVVRVIADATH